MFPSFLAGVFVLPCVVGVSTKGDTLFVANVGDSRAILCTRGEGGESAVRPLSVDQTPFRKDERERIKKAGGHVLTIDQIEGLEVRPILCGEKT